MNERKQLSVKSTKYERIMLIKISKEVVISKNYNDYEQNPVAIYNIT